MSKIIHCAQANMTFSDKAHTFTRQVSSMLANGCKRNSQSPQWLNKRGFTLIEILVVLTILLALSMLGLSTLTEFKTRARINRAAAEIRFLEREINAHALETGTLPGSLADLKIQSLRDPWGRPYEYHPYDAGNMRERAGLELNNDYDLYSLGLDGLFNRSIAQPGGKDDVIRVNEGRWVGLAENY